MKQAGWICAAVLGAFLVVGAGSGYEDGRFKLVVMECQRDYYEFNKDLPSRSEKVSYCFKLDKENGDVWILKDERREMPNSSKILVKQYFQSLPYEDTVLPNRR